jgi:hypothetical protein
MALNPGKTQQPCVGKGPKGSEGARRVGNGSKVGSKPGKTHQPFWGEVQKGRKWPRGAMQAEG